MRDRFRSRHQFSLRHHFVYQADAVRFLRADHLAGEQQLQRQALAQLPEDFEGTVVLLSPAAWSDAADHKARVLTDCWPLLALDPRAVVGEPWAEPAFEWNELLPEEFWSGCRGARDKPRPTQSPPEASWPPRLRDRS